jgi:hypothetical protein
MKTIPSILLLTALLIAPAHAEGGPLDPPPGAPAPTMKSLAQVEPRTAITALPYEINASGSYYLTGPLFSATGGITVNASDVTIDLMGFTLSGLNSAAHHGIHVAGGTDVELSNVVIRNGGITNFGHGILVQNTRGGEISGIISHQNALDGIRLQQLDPGSCTDFTVTRCTLRGNGGAGMSANGNSSERRNRDHIITRNLISGNAQYGIILFGGHGLRITHNEFGRQNHLTNPTSMLVTNGFYIITNNTSYGDVTFRTGAGVTVVIGQVVTTTGTISADPFANFHFATP